MEIDVTPNHNSDTKNQNEVEAEEETIEEHHSGSVQPQNEQHECFNSNKKPIKHMLRQRRRKSHVPRIIVKPLPAPESNNPKSKHFSTMKEVLASIPGFNMMKTRKRTTKKLSTAAQLEQTKAGCIDLETPDSILVNTNLRLLLNKATFASLPILYQNKLAQLLPIVDRQLISSTSSELISSELNNEFFARACLEWQDRLAEGEFTPENQQKLKLEADKERNKLDPWKLKHFEPIWGYKSSPNDPDGPGAAATATAAAPAPDLDVSRPPIKTTIKLNKISVKNPVPVVKRVRTVGAVTRSCSSLKQELKPHLLPDLLPINNKSTSKVSHEQESASLTTSANRHNSSSSVDGKCVVNLSDHVLVSNQETIIEAKKRPCEYETSPNHHNQSPKRMKSLSPDSLLEKDDHRSINETATNNCLMEVSSDDDKVSSENTENSSSSSSMSSLITEKVSSNNNSSENNAIIETVDSLQLHIMNYSNEEEEEEEEEEEQVINEENSSQSSSSSSSLSSSEHLFENHNNMETADDGEQELLQQQEEEETSVVNEVMLVNSSLTTPFECEGEHQREEEQEKMQELTVLPMLPNSLIIQQQQQEEEDDEEEEVESSLVLENIGEVSAEKLEASVEEADLVSFSDKIIRPEDGSAETTVAEEEEEEESRFMDAESYVLESGQISIQQQTSEIVKTSVTMEMTGEEDEEVRRRIPLFADNNVSSNVNNEDSCCWGLVDSSTENLLQVAQLEEASTSGGASITVQNDDIQGNENVQVIPMQEELEVRLEQGTFPVPNLTAWPYDVKMVEAPLNSPTTTTATTTTVTINHHASEQKAAEFNNKIPLAYSSKYPISAQSSAQQMPQQSHCNQVKLELEVTLTPEITAHSDALISSTTVSSINNHHHNNEVTATPGNKTVATTVIPPTTIVCLPTATPPVINHVPPPEGGASIGRPPGAVQSSSALPYLALSTSQPIRAVPAHSTKSTKPKNTNLGTRNRGNSSKPPPGAVNLERSYQICQAVIQNSPNRDQLKCQLKPPPSLLAAVASVGTTNNTNGNKKTTDVNRLNQTVQYSSVTSSRSGANKTFTTPTPLTAAAATSSSTGNSFPVSINRYNGIKTIGQQKIGRSGLFGFPQQQQQQQQQQLHHQQRQNNSPPVVVRHVFTTSAQGIPVTMAVLPQGSALSPDIVDAHNHQQHQNPIGGTVGQYILIPRSSSAPPTQQQQQPPPTLNVTGNATAINQNSVATPVTRGRPASVESEPRLLAPPSAIFNNNHMIEGPNPGTQAVTRPRLRQQAPPPSVGVVYGAEGQLTTIIGENLITEHPAAAVVTTQQQESSCACNLKAMVVCKKCGAFCHDDCIGPNKLCRTCFIR